MQKLITGLHHFQSKVFPSHKELFKRLAIHGQTPETLFITCSDSRISPSLLTQTNPGELFILRNAGNIVPPYTAIISGEAATGEAATIEYAVAALKVKDIIVCGHSQCGAMNGLLHSEQLCNLPIVTAWLKHAQAVKATIEANYSHLDDKQQLDVATQENVLAQLENLRSHPAVQSSLASGQLKLHGWIYEIETGEMFVYQADTEQFAALTQETASEASTEQTDKATPKTKTPRNKTKANQTLVGLAQSSLLLEFVTSNFNQEILCLMANL